VHILNETIYEAIQETTFTVAGAVLELQVNLRTNFPFNLTRLKRQTPRARKLSCHDSGVKQNFHLITE
jgi:hypothetical protein